MGDIDENIDVNLSEKPSEVLWKVNQTPPLCTCILLGLQHYLAMFVATLSIPLVLSPHLCMDDDIVGQAKLVGTLFFTCGIITTVQVVFGVRLPIIQAGTFALLSPTMAYLSLPHMKCPRRIVASGNISEISLNGTDIIRGSIEHQNLWQGRLSEIQGSLMVVACIEIVFGLSGAVGYLLKYIGPLSISPTIALLGLSLFQPASNFGAKHWPTCIVTMVLILIFSLYLSRFAVPLPTYNRSKSRCSVKRTKIFNMFPVLIAMCLSWLLCWILTMSDTLPNEARTDAKLQVIYDSPWFRLPWPFQWGAPKVKLPAVLGLMAGILATTVESVGDYYACARLAGAPPPPPSAVNRGILIEGIGSFFDGILGTGNGTTSTSINVGVVGLTRVGSRSVVLVSAFLMSFLGVFCKFGAIFVTIPEPVVGGAFFMLFGMIFAVGISSLKTVDLNSPRNLGIFGFSFFFGMAVPQWVKANPHAIDTGSPTADSALTVLISTSMFVGGVIGFFLDNTVPGSKKERGLLPQSEEEIQNDVSSIYDLPFNIGKLSRYFRYIPICPAFEGFNRKRHRVTSNHTTSENFKETTEFVNISNEQL
ncbi:DgyrCDS3826 [Dimorphilus gyrociliatus]|uniref:DgyrCDS3826 n=1 Tax=Dimorphilus gyrociliatus TaxID=2664684 RepID=A0A7I8VGK1_9ANNE|nr:DgyrCDS3826 [Dimorphilus gyrociliatus]